MQQLPQFQRRRKRRGGQRDMHGPGSWCSLAVSDLANLYVFLTVAERLSA